MRKSIVAVAALLALAGCGGSTSPEPTATPSPAPSTSNPAPSPSAAPSGGPPVLVVHLDSDTTDVALTMAEYILDAQPGASVYLEADDPLTLIAGADPAAAIAQVAADPAGLAVVPLGAVDDTVRVLTVDGVDPVQDPDAYPLAGE